MDIQSPFFTRRANDLLGYALDAAYFVSYSIDNPEEVTLDQIFNAARYSVRKARQAIAAERKATRNVKVRMRQVLYMQGCKVEQAVNRAAFSGDKELWAIAHEEQTKAERYLAFYFATYPNERN